MCIRDSGMTARGGRRADPGVTKRGVEGEGVGDAVLQCEEGVVLLLGIVKPAARVLGRHFFRRNPELIEALVGIGGRDVELAFRRQPGGQPLGLDGERAERRSGKKSKQFFHEWWNQWRFTSAIGWA